MLRFTLRQIQYFIAVGEAGNITLAAERIHISPPSISTAISHLETELGTKLFVRHHAQGLSLTPTGRTLLAEAKRLVSQAEQISIVAAEVTGTVVGNLTAGCLVTLAPMLMPELAHSFISAYPATSIQHFVSDHERLMNALSSAEIDVALTYDLGVPPGIEFLPLAGLPPHVVVGEAHRVAEYAAVSLEEMADENLILLDLPASRDYFLGLFLQAGVQPKIGLRLAYPDVIRTMVANHYGYTISNVTPRMDLALDGRRVVRIPLIGDHTPTVIGLATTIDDKPTRLVDAFIHHCREMISDFSIPGMVAPALERSYRLGRPG